MSFPNYEYISKNYTLPVWFNINDIDWLRNYPTKNGKTYQKHSIRSIKRKLIEEKKGHFTYIYNDEKVNIYSILTRYIWYLLEGGVVLDGDITDIDMNVLLAIKICDYDWLFKNSNPVFDKESEATLLQKI